MSQQLIIEESPLSKFLFSNVKMSWLWLIIRVYVGYEWITAGWAKINESIWTGSDAGGALSGFIQGSLSKATGPHPDVTNWYSSFLQNCVLPHANAWSHMIAWGEFLVGIALILGLLTGIAAFFGLFMNLNYLLAGTVSVNPILLVLSIFIILAWKTAGFLGLDYFALPCLGTPWQKGRIFKKKTS